MFIHQMTDRVWQLPSVDWNRRLFDALIPLPDGTSYNAYLVRGSEKTALIDSTEPALGGGLLAALESMPAIDYLISNHAEQDHSGMLPDLLARYPTARIVCTPKAKPMLIDLLALPEDVFLTVEDGDNLSLGECSLEFIHTPWVHWPETMSVYFSADKTLFSCDFFGSHFATSAAYVDDERLAYEGAKRYYAEIMMPFARQIRRHLEKLSQYDIAIIAPSHGPAHRRPAFIMDAYREWVSEQPKNLAVIPYVSMHESTHIMASRLVDSLVAGGVQVQPFDLSDMDIGKLAMALVDAGTIVMGTPTVLAGPHPQAVYAAVLANSLRPKARFLSVFGSYLWGGKAVETITGLLSNVRAELLEPVYVRGMPRAEDLAAIERLAAAIVERHQDAGLA